jgi:hypothetical protein
MFVFGYGSLAAGSGGRRARLRGHRRVWGVAMDNRVALPGYKIYRRRDDDSWPDVFVAFLDIAEHAAATTEGVLFAIDDVALRALDERERNYVRFDATAHVDDAPGTVWAYRGSDAGRERLRHAVRRGNAVVARAYLERVRATFATRGIAADVEPRAPLAVMDLERVDLGAGPRRDQPE